MTTLFIVAAVLWTLIVALFVYWAVRYYTKPKKKYSAPVCVTTITYADEYDVWRCEGVDEIEAFVNLQERIRQVYPGCKNIRVVGPGLVED